MLTAEIPTSPAVSSGRPIAKSGLRVLLKAATEPAHRALDERFAQFKISTFEGYRGFLEASAAALVPLEAALVAAGVENMFPDWHRRSREGAIRTDLARLGGTVRPLPAVHLGGTGAVLGAMYVLEGSRLGARYLMKTMAASPDPQLLEATAYLAHGAGQPLWQSFLLTLEREATEAVLEDDVIAAAHRAFAIFADAAARA